MNFKQKLKLGIFVVTGSLVLGLVAAPSVDQFFHPLDGQVSVISNSATTITVKAIRQRAKMVKSRSTQTVATPTATRTSFTITGPAPRPVPVVYREPGRPRSATSLGKPVAVASHQTSQRPAKLGPAVKN